MKQIDWLTGEDLLISFSGGKTSALMTKLILEQRPDAKVVFANTGLEHKKTIEFVKKCSAYFNFNLVVLEANVIHEARKGTTYKQTTLDKLAMNGEPFEQAVIKYGIPNTGFPHCTRELKISPIHKWAKDHLSSRYETAIGIRADEMDRVPTDYVKKRYKYPLLNWGITKKDVVSFWEQQPFNLEIEEHLGNCVTCWKKSDRKLFKIANEEPGAFDFMRKMEAQYANNGAGTGNRRFFRKHRSVFDIEALAKAKHEDEDTDVTNGCEESCEVF